jgi:hypothetical protein
MEMADDVDIDALPTFINVTTSLSSSPSSNTA